MRKQELIQLHTLGFRLAQHMVGADDLPSDQFAEYLTQSTRPIDVTGSKTDHKEALLPLFASLAELADEPATTAETDDEREPVSPPT